MKLRRLPISAAVAFVLSFVGATAKAANKDIIETAIQAGSFSTLIEAIDVAGLTDTLKGEGPFTVFAPTDAAFAQLPEGTLDELLKPENKDKLISILTYHVVPNKVVAADISGKMKTLATLQGDELTINAAGRVAKVDQAAIQQPDVMASNGVIHVIDIVVMPR